MKSRDQHHNHTTDSNSNPGTPATAVPVHANLANRIINLFAILTPFAALIVAVVLLWGRGVDLLYMLIFAGMYIGTALGVTVGFHRLFTHRSFETGRVMQAVLALLGSMAVEGPLLRWVATHRCHHQHSDHEEDPHSPHTYGAGALNVLRGFWRAHVGWIVGPQRTDLDRYNADLRSDRFVRALSALFPLWVVLGLAIPGVLGGIISGTWTGAFLGVLWGGLVRIFFVHHMTWSINSVCHLWGTQPFRSHDESRNNVIFGVFGFGEGWHNNHHAFPTSARHGLRWWEIDISYWVIVGMEKLGLARRVRLVPASRMEAKRKQ